MDLNGDNVFGLISHGLGSQKGELFAYHQGGDDEEYG